MSGYLPGIPREILSQDYSENCLPRIRAHLRDLEAGEAALSDVKLMVLGNGRAGKTQICRRLRGEDYDEAVSSTHGISVSTAPIANLESTSPPGLWHLWDFGGQDVYHGTHALFLRTRAVFLIAWARETEDAATHEHGGMVFRNNPLPYWLAFVRYLAGPESPVIVVQARCDRPEDDAKFPPLSDADVADFPFVKFVHYSALKDRGRAALNEALHEAAVWLRNRRGPASIGAGRLRVQRKLEDLRAADAAVPPGERQYRSLSRAHFQALCTEAGGVSAPEHLLDYLHHAGVVFYRPGLFGDRIVLDQGWALDAIYTVFNRERCFRSLRQLRGRFTRSLLEALAWQEHSEADQQLFLDMMESCGIVFVHKPGDRETETEYIAPELLPERSELATELAERWDEAAPAKLTLYRYDLHQPGLLRGLVAAIGREAGVNALYWKDGVCVYEETTRARALIEQEAQGGWTGLVRICTQGGRAAELLAALRRKLESENGRWGLHPVKPAGRPLALGRARTGATCGDGSGASTGASPLRTRAAGENEPPALSYVQEPASGPEFCVSYAWGDATPEGQEREAVVDRLCADAETRGIRIVRDKATLGLGDRITRFMQRIGRADRVFVILNDKYLKSPYCMYELFEIWRNSKGEEEAFLERVRVYTLKDAAIFSPLHRAQYAVHWKQQHEELAAIMREHGADILGEEDFRKFKLMQDFAHRVGDILATLADVVQPRDFDSLARCGFDDPPPTHQSPLS